MADELNPEQISEQLSLMQQMTKAASNLTKGLRSVTSAQQDLNKAIEEGAEAAEKNNSQAGVSASTLNELKKITKDAPFGSWTKGADDFLKKFPKLGGGIAGMAKKFPKLSGAITTATKALGPLQAGFAAFTVVTKTGFQAMKMYYTTMVGLYKAFEGFIDKVGGAAKTVEIWARQVFTATEQVRGQIGDLATGVGGATMEMMESLQGVGTVSVGAIFGPYEEGAVALRAFLGETISAFGNMAEVIKGNLAAAGDSILALKKGLNLGGEAMTNLASRTLATGKTLKQTYDEVLVSTATLARKMGVSSKTIGKNIDKIAGDMAHFGHLTTQQMTQLAATLAKTGIEMKTVLGIAQKFDMFGDAAQNVAKLNQAFGMQLDAYEMMNASDEERMAMLQASFQATGRNISDLSRQERQYLAQQAGVDANELDKFFGNYAMGLDDVAAGAADAAEEQLTQEEALNQIAKTVQKVNGYLVEATNVLSAFFEGFNMGFMRSKEFQEFAEDLRGIIYGVFGAAEEGGKEFAKVVKELGGFETILNWVRQTATALKSVAGLFGPLAEGLKGAGTVAEKEKVWDTFFDGLFKALEPMTTRFVDFISTALDKAADFLDGSTGGPLAASLEKFLTKVFTNIVFPVLVKLAQQALVIIGTGLIAGATTVLLAALISSTAGLPLVLGTVLVAAFGVAFIAIGGKWEELLEMLSYSFNAWVALILAPIDVIGGFLLDLPKGFGVALENALNNLSGWISWIFNAKDLKEAMANFLGTITSFFSISSPSKVMQDEVGKPLGEGLMGGLTGILSGLPEAMTSFFTGDAFSGAFGAISEVGSSLLSNLVPDVEIPDLGEIVTNTVDGIDEIGMAIDSLPKELELFTQLKEIGAGKTEIEETLKVELQKAEFTFNLHIALDADSLADALASKTVVTRPLQQA